MEVLSLGCRTDLMVRRLGGSVVEDHGDHLTVMTPANPSFWWGNFIVVAGPFGDGDAERCIEVFDKEFPDADHVAIAVAQADRAQGDLVDLREFIDRGVLVEYSTVMTASALKPPSRGNDRAVCRPLVSDEDWRLALDLAMACNESIAPADYLPYVRRSLEEARGMAQRGHGAWFGAFTGDELMASLGVFGDGHGDARYQRVETHPDARRQGLAGTLVHAAGEYAREQLGAKRLVIVADPNHPAAGLYRSLGFEDAEAQLQLLRSPSSEPAQEGIEDLAAAAVEEEREYRQYRFRRPPGACEILLVRHGESAPYRDGMSHPMVDGQGDPPLDPVGVEQAQHVADRFRHSGEPITAVYVTTLQRTVQTAAPMLEVLGMEATVEPRLREVHLGDWEGGELRRRYANGDPLTRRLSETGRWDILPGAESGDAFAERVRTGVNDIASRHPDQLVVVVVHGGVIGQVMAQATGAPPLGFGGADNGSISHLVVWDGHWIVRCFNDTSHLSPTFSTGDAVQNHAPR